MDKNQADNSIFCVDPNIIKDTFNVESIDKTIKPFVFKSRYKGLFHDFDCQANKVSENTTNNSVIKNHNDCCHKDHVAYIIQKKDYETMELNEVGVKNLTQYKIVHSYKNEDNVPIVFLNHQPHKGLTLFNRAIIEMNSHALDTLQNTALQVIDDVFGIRCDRYAAIYTTSLDHRFVSIKWTQPTKFPKALYDLKRAMDYLPVKATKNANLTFSQHDLIYFYVSSDRLAISYALLQGCPCILVDKGGTTFHIYNHKGSVMHGGRSMIPLKPETKLDSPSEVGERTQLDIELQFVHVHANRQSFA